MTSKQKTWPAETNEAHPEVFTKMPPQPKEKKPGQLPESVVRDFFEKGYVVVEDYFPLELLDKCRDAVEEEVEKIAQKLYKAGKISKTYEELGLCDRLTAIDKEFKGANVVLHKANNLPKAVQELWSNERLLNAVEQLIGPDIMGHPVWNLRCKTPQTETATVPWHQDISYLDNDSYSVLQVTAWIPFLDATEQNGCLQMAEKGHRTGRVACHHCCAGDTWYVMLDETEMEKTLGVDLKTDLKVLPVKYGGMVLFSNIIPHRSLPNLSDKIRWSVDLRWQTPDHPAGFHGLKDGVKMRSSKDPNLKPDFDTFTETNRLPTGEDEFDTTVAGPWMSRWEITHPNRHTAMLDKRKSMWTKA